MSSPQAIESVDSAGEQRILAAAEALFAGQGFDAVSVSAIAEAAGVSKANVFHHFPNKNELYLAVLRQVCQQGCRQIQELAVQSSNTQEALRQFAAAHLALIFERSEFARLVLRELLESGERRGKEFAEQGLAEGFGRLVEIIRAGQQAGELRVDLDPAVAAVMMTAMNIYFFQAREVLRHYPAFGFADDPAAFSRQAMDVLLHGMLSGAPANKNN